MSKTPGVLRFKRRAVKVLMLLVVFIAACITSIDNVQITGLFADAAGQVPMDAGDAHGIIYFGVHVDFSFNPNFFEDNPPHPEARIATSFRLGTGQAIPGAFDTTLVPDGDYTVIAAAAPFGAFDTGYGESGPFPFHVNNAGHGGTGLGRRPRMAHTGGPQGPAQNTPKTGDDINPCTGELSISAQDLGVTARGMQMLFTRTYRSQIDYNGPLGCGWNFNFNQQLVAQTDGSIQLADGSNYIVTFTPDGTGGFVAPPGIYLVLTRNTDGTYTIRERGGSKRLFAANGLLSAVVDHNQNQISLEYDFQFNLTAIRDCLGRAFTLAYTPDGLVKSLSDFTGRTVTYDYDGNANLIAVTWPPSPAFPAGRTTRYTYSAGQVTPELNHNLLTITDPNGQTYLDNTYDSQDRVISQRLNAGTMQLDYQVPGARTVLTDREQNQTVFEFDSAGHVTTQTQRTRGLRASDPPGYTTTTRYNAHGEFAERVFPRGNSIQYIYDDQNVDRLAQQNLLQTRQRAGALGTQPDLVTRYTYEPRFQRVKTIVSPRGSDPAEGPPTRFLTTFFYDYEEGAALGADLNGDGVTTQNAGNLVKAVYPSTSNVDFAGQTTSLNVVTMTYTYDDHGLLLSQVLPTGTKNRIDYFPPTGLPNDTESREGYPQRLVRDVNGVAATTTFERDQRGNILAVIDPNGHRSIIEYSPSDRVVRTVASAPFNYERTVSYDANDDPIRISVQNVRGTISGQNVPDADLPIINTTLTYTPGRTVASVEQTVTSTHTTKVTLTYDKNDRLTRITSPLGNKTDIAYDERGMPLSRTRGAGTAEASSEFFSYDANGLLEQRIDPRGAISRFAHDPFDRLISSVDPEGATVQLSRNAAGAITQQRAFDTSTRGGSLLKELNNQFDELGQVLRTVRPIFGPGIPTSQAVTLLQRDAGGRLTRVLNPNQHETRLEYDGLDRVTRHVDALNNDIRMEYDHAGNVTSKTTRSFNPATSAFETFRTAALYDELNRAVLTVDNIGRMRRVAYDSRSHVVATADANGPVTLQGNDPGNTKSRFFDGRGRLVLSTEDLRQGGHGAGSVTHAIQTRMVWDDDGRMSAQQDDNGNLTQYAYDNLDRLVGLAYPDGSRQSFSYDAAGNPTQITQPNGTTIANQYSPANRLISRTIARSAGVLGEAFESYQYDGLGRSVSLVNDQARAEFVFDSLDRVLKDIQDGKAASSTYDAAGNRTKLKYPGGRELAATFDTLERLTQLRDLADATPLATFSYIGHERLGGSRYQNSTSLKVLYDQAPRPEALVFSTDRQGSEQSKKGLEVFGGFQYVFDRENNQLAQIDLKKDHRSPSDYTTADGDLYRYDSAYRLTKQIFDVEKPLLGLLNPGKSEASGQVTYNIDGVDNWTSTIESSGRGYGDTDRSARVTNYTINNLNEVTAVNGKAIQYDLNGSRIQDSKFQYNYNYRGQLARATRRMSGHRNYVINFKYDPLGRRVAREASIATRPHDPKSKECERDKDDDGDEDSWLTSAKSTRFFFDGRRLIEEQDPRGRTVRSYVHRGGLSSPLGMDVASDDDECEWRDDDKKASGQRRRFFFHQNLLGSVTHVTDNKGRVAESYAYDAYGVPRRQDEERFERRSGFKSRLGNPFLFAGQRYEPSLGLYDLRNRDYDPALGRFLSRDPLGLLAGNNLFAYCRNNPTNFLDPMGLSRKSGIDLLLSGIDNLLDLAESALEGAFMGALLAAVGAELLVAGVVAAAALTVEAIIASTVFGVAAHGVQSGLEMTLVDAGMDPANANRVARGAGVIVGGLLLSHIIESSGPVMEGDAPVEGPSPRESSAETAELGRGDSVDSAGWSGEGRPPGEALGDKRIGSLTDFMQRNNVTVRVAEDGVIKVDDGRTFSLGADEGARFTPVEGTNRAELWVRPDLTVYETLHEFGHYQDWVNLGPKAYAELPRTPEWNASEQMVFDYIEGTRSIWNRLSEAEREHAIWYLYQRGGFR